MAVTQKEIAARLGVDKTLVGKALAGHPRVSQATRLRVEQVALEMGYTATSNAAARALAAQRHGVRAQTGTYAVLYQRDHGGAPARSLPYYTLLFEAIESECLRRGLDTLLLPFRAQGLQRILREGLVDGALLIGFDASHTLLEQLGLPYVMLNSVQDGVPCVRPDGYAGMRLLVEHLAGLGHTRIGYLGHAADFPVSAERIQGFRDGMRQFHLDLPETALETTLYSQSPEYVAPALQHLMERSGRSLSAIVCYNDAIAMGAVRALQQHGLHVPGDVSIAGFDDITTASGFAPAITSISFSQLDLAGTALQLLESLMSEGGTAANSTATNSTVPSVAINVALRVHQSTAAPGARTGHA